MLIGRNRERRRLRDTLAAARSDRGAALVIRGEPGIGKTALLDDLRAEAEGFRVLSARGAESESSLAFAGLADILRPVLDRRDALPAAQRAALEAAMALGPPAVPDRFAAYAATLGLLGALARDRPLLVLVDDGHWLDVPTQEALLFCARRLLDDPVAMVATSREVPAERLDLTGVEELVLGPLDDAAGRRLLVRTVGDLPATVVDAILEGAAGNPLALVELARSLSADERAGRRALPRTLRAGEVLARAYRGRVEGLSQGARRAALLVALSEDGALGALLPALSAGRAGARELAEVEAAGLVTVTEDHARVRHPLLRSVVLGIASPAERRAAHVDLAAALDPRGAPEQRAWHLAEASLGPDEVAAEAMELAAGVAASRTGYAAAAASLERAARLTPETAARGRRFLRAAELALAAGRPAWSLALLDEGEAGADGAHLQGVIALVTGHPDRAFQMLVEGAERAAPADPAAATRMLADAVLTRTMVGDCRAAVAVARRAYAVGGPHLSSSPSLVGYFAGALTLVGEGRAAGALIEHFDALTADVDPASPAGQMLVLSASWRPWIGDLERTAERLDAWVEQARESGALAFLAFVLPFAAEVDFRVGRWQLGRSRGLESLSLLVETGQLGPLGYATCAVARLEAGLGRPEAERAREVLAVSEALGIASTITYARSALGFAALARGDPAEAVEQVGPLVEIAADSGLREPSTVMWQPDLVEALVRLGRRDDPRRALATLSEQAHRTDGLWSQAVTRRCRGLVDDDVDRHFGEALRLHARLPMPFERARTQLLYGSRLRRAGRRTEARAQLEGARATFDDLGAQPWARQAREAIAAGGARLRPRGAAGPELSPRELQVALTVAEGATNREAAARLFLSEKTIERHLGSVYRALGLRSRAELARHFARGAGQAGTTDGAGPASSSSESQ